MNIGLVVVLIIIAAFILIKAADLTIVAIRRLSRGSKSGIYALSAIVLAIGTSFPELFVGLTSALEGHPQLSLGDVTGSNIANIALVGGLAALISGTVYVRGKKLARDSIIAFAAGLLPILLLIDGTLTRVDGLILLVIYIGYASSFFRSSFKEIAEESLDEEFVYRFMRRFNHVDSRRAKDIGRLVIGIAVMLFSADVIVRLSTNLAELANISPLVIGLVVIAIGTSLPEFAFSLRSLRRHHPSMFFGNLLGSTIANSTLVLGIVAIIAPFSVELSQYLKAAIAFAVVFLAFWVFTRTKHRLARWEAVILLLLYAAFVIAVVV